MFYYNVYQFTQVQFEEMIYPETIVIYETKNAGAITCIQILQPDGEWFTLWETDTVTKIDQPVIFTPDFQVS